MRIKQISLGLLSVFIVNAHAKQTPLSFATDSRIKQVAYQNNNVVAIKGSPFTTTQIIFSQDEVIQDIEGGDSSSWMISHQDNLANMLFIKPTSLGLKANLTIVTNKHTYYFDLSSSKELSNKNKETYAVKFIYPQDERKILNRKLKLEQQRKEALVSNPQSPKNYNWQYSFSGNKQIMPLHVFDDGRFTYFELRPNQSVPAVFVISNKSGRESVVNLRRQGNYLVAHLTAPQFTLREGSRRVASVFNKNAIHQVRG